MTEVVQWNAHELSVRIHRGDVSCLEVMQAYLARIHALNPRFNAIVSLADDDVLLAQASARDDELARGQSRGWMHGMPQAIKDMAAVTGFPATQGSPLLQDAMPGADSVVAARMKSAGSIVIGKTNTPELGLG